MYSFWVVCVCQEHFLLYNSLTMYNCIFNLPRNNLTASHSRKTMAKKINYPQINIAAWACKPALQIIGKSKSIFNVIFVPQPLLHQHDKHYNLWLQKNKKDTYPGKTIFMQLYKHPEWNMCIHKFKLNSNKQTNMLPSVFSFMLCCDTIFWYLVQLEDTGIKAL